ncbi:hypothetical protein ACIQVK_19580 [Streptomyces sp. NPDC090493]|uniref:hypothetical protein n=1 Tax=Streptomyces sp. NPDC090493 TaxID=3365964 RepID=UPI00382825ED
MSSISATAAAVPRVDAAAGTAAVVAPYDGGGPYLQGFTQLGWRTVAVLPEPRLRPLAYQATVAPAGYTGTVVHRLLRHTVKALRAIGVSVVVVGSAAGIELAERIAWHLGLPGADPASSPLRYDRGVQAGVLSRAGIPTVRGIRTTSLADAVAWTQRFPLPGYRLGPAVAGSPVAGAVCTSDLQISAAWPAMRRAAAGYTGSAHLLLTEQHSPRQYTLHSTTRPGQDGRPEHLITDAWAEIRTSSGQLDRTDLLPHHGLLTRTLSLYAMRALDALGVMCGPATARLAYGVDDGASDGPLVLSVLTAPVVTPADEALRRARGRDRAADAVAPWIPAPAAPVPAPAPQHIVRVHLRNGDVLSAWTARRLRSLPTVVAISERHIPGMSPGAEAVLSSGDLRAIEQDYRAIRALDQSAPTTSWDRP